MAEEIKKTEINADESKKAEESKKTEESIAERLAKLELENKKLKSSVDKASSEAADYKKRWKATQSEAEQRAIEKAEEEAAKDERIKRLERENAINNLAKSFMALGYSEDNANEAAEAQYDNDTDTLFKLQKSHMDNIKATIKEDLMKSMPKPPVGSEEGTTITADQFGSMGYLEKLDFKKKYPETYKKYTQNI